MIQELMVVPYPPRGLLSLTLSSSFGPLDCSDGLLNEIGLNSSGLFYGHRTPIWILDYNKPSCIIMYKVSYKGIRPSRGHIIESIRVQDVITRY